MSKEIILRCDYFQGSGIGHLKRTSILSSALQKRGYRTLVLIDDDPPENTFNMGVVYKKLPLQSFNELDDAKFILNLANLRDVKIIIGDSYRITKKWVTKLKDNGLKVILLDLRLVGLYTYLFLNQDDEKVCIPLIFCPR